MTNPTPSAPQPPATPTFAKDEYEVTITVGVRIRRTGQWPSLRDEMEHVVHALMRGGAKAFPETEYPKGSVTLGDIEARVLDAAGLRRRWNREQREKRR